MPNQENRIFHTDQGKWDRRDFFDDEFNRTINDSEIRVSLEGHRPEEYDPGLALGVHEDQYQKPFGHIYSDQELERVVQELLRNSKEIEVEDIQIHAQETNLILKGSVKDLKQKEKVTELAQLIHGIGHIKNDLTVKSPAP